MNLGSTLKVTPNGKTFGPSNLNVSRVCVTPEITKPGFLFSRIGEMATIRAYAQLPINAIIGFSVPEVVSCHQYPTVQRPPILMFPHNRRISFA